MSEFTMRTSHGNVYTPPASPPASLRLQTGAGLQLKAFKNKHTVYDQSVTLTSMELTEMNLKHSSYSPLIKDNFDLQ